MKNTTHWNAGIYARISKDDNSREYSIENQKKRIYDFIDSHWEEFQHTAIYMDVGASGSNSDREDFSRMLHDIKEKRINCVIVKDLSRLSRNYYEAGYYLDYLFTSLNVRFISLEYPFLDSHRFPNMMHSVMIPMQNVVNDDFCRQTSIKVRNTLRMKQEKGDFIGAFAPYGYSKHPNSKHQLVIDEGAADTVRMMFHWYVKEDMSRSGIVQKLNHLGILPPGAYKQSKGLPYYCNTIGFRPMLWSLSAVSRVLGNPVYVGNMVQGRQRSQNYKTGKVVNVPREEWIIVEGTHTPLISQDLFEKAQEKLAHKLRDRCPKNADYPFSGLIRCAQCHKAMTRKSVSRYAYYRCKTYCEQSKHSCSGHSIREDRLKEIMLQVLRVHTEMVADTVLLPQIQFQPPATDTYENQLDRFVEQQQRHLQRIAHYKKSIYQDWKDGSITKEDFDRYGKEYRLEIKEAQRALAVLGQEKNKLPEREKDKDEELTQFLTSKAFPEITRSLARQFIERIEVDQDGDMTVHLRFRDPFMELIESQ